MTTDPALLELIERSKSHVMSPEEIYEQRRSFVRGMCPSNRNYKEWCETVNRMMPPLVAQPEYLSGCQLRGPGECQSRGLCQSQSCKHAGKVVAPRMCVEPKQDGIVYPKPEN